MISYLALSALLNLLWSFLDSSVLLQMALFHSFYEYYSIVCMYHIFFITPLSMDI